MIDKEDFSQPDMTSKVEDFSQPDMKVEDFSKPDLERPQDAYERGIAEKRRRREELLNGQSYTYGLPVAGKNDKSNEELDSINKSIMLHETEKNDDATRSVSYGNGTTLKDGETYTDGNGEYYRFDYEAAKRGEDPRISISPGAYYKAHANDEQAPKPKGKTPNTDELKAIKEHNEKRTKAQASVNDVMARYDEKFGKKTGNADITAEELGGNEKALTKEEHARIKGYGGNIDHLDRPMLLERDKDGKVTGYATTKSMVIPKNTYEVDGKPYMRFGKGEDEYVVIPKIKRDKDGKAVEMTPEEARREYEKTGNNYGTFASKEEAEKASEDIHNAHQKLYAGKWHQYVRENWDDIAESVKDEGTTRDYAAWDKAGRPAAAYYDVAKERESRAEKKMEEMSRTLGEDLRAKFEAETGRKDAPASEIVLYNMPFWKPAYAADAMEKQRQYESLMDGTWRFGNATENTDMSGGTVVLDKDLQQEVRNYIEEKGALTEEEQQAAAAEYGYEKLREMTQTKQEASEFLSRTNLPWYDTMVSGGLDALTLSAEYAMGGMAGAGVNAALKGALKGAEIALPSILSASNRFSSLTENEYRVDADGNLVMTASGDDPTRAFFHAVPGGLVEAAVEKYLFDNPITKHIKGLGPIRNVRGRVLEWIAKSPRANNIMKGFGKLSEYTAFNGLPEEMLEEDVQEVFDNVFGLGRRSGEEYQGSPLFTAKGQADLFLSMALMMVVQASAGAALNAAQRKQFEDYNQKQHERVKTVYDITGLDKKVLDGMDDNGKAKLLEFYQKYGGNPEELMKRAEAFFGEDGAMSQLLRQMAERKNIRMKESLEARGVEPKPFTIPTDADGRVVFTQKRIIHPQHGPIGTFKVADDPNTQIAIADLGDGTYLVIDQANGKLAYRADSVGEAVTAAENLSLMNQERQLDNEQKAQYADTMAKQNGLKVVSYENEEQAIQAFGADEGSALFKADAKGNKTTAVVRDGAIHLILDNITSPAMMDQAINAAAGVAEKQAVGGLNPAASVPIVLEDVAPAAEQTAETTVETETTENTAVTEPEVAETTENTPEMTQEASQEVHTDNVPSGNENAPTGVYAQYKAKPIRNEKGELVAPFTDDERNAYVQARLKEMGVTGADATDAQLKTIEGEVASIEKPYRDAMEAQRKAQNRAKFLKANPKTKTSRSAFAEQASGAEGYMGSFEYGKVSLPVDFERTQPGGKVVFTSDPMADVITNLLNGHGELRMSKRGKIYLTGSKFVPKRLQTIFGTSFSVGGNDNLMRDFAEHVLHVDEADATGESVIKAMESDERAYQKWKAKGMRRADGTTDIGALIEDLKAQAEQNINEFGKDYYESEEYRAEQNLIAKLEEIAEGGADAASAIEDEVQRGRWSEDDGFAIMSDGTKIRVTDNGNGMVTITDFDSGEEFIVPDGIELQGDNEHDRRTNDGGTQAVQAKQGEEGGGTAVGGSGTENAETAENARNAPGTVRLDDRRKDRSAVRFIEIDGKPTPIQSVDFVALNEEDDGASIPVDKLIVKTDADKARLFQQFYTNKGERTKILFLDKDGNVMGVEVTHLGCAGSTDGKSLLLKAIRNGLPNGCARIVLSHNHPTGNVEPSPMDRAVTKALRAELDAAGLSDLAFEHLITDTTKFFRMDGRDTNGGTVEKAVLVDTNGLNADTSLTPRNTMDQIQQLVGRLLLSSATPNQSWLVGLDADSHIVGVVQIPADGDFGKIAPLMPSARVFAIGIGKNGFDGANLLKTADAALGSYALKDHKGATQKVSDFSIAYIATFDGKDIKPEKYDGNAMSYENHTAFRQLLADHAKRAEEPKYIREARAFLDKLADNQRLSFTRQGELMFVHGQDKQDTMSIKGDLKANGFKYHPDKQLWSYDYNAIPQGSKILAKINEAPNATDEAITQRNAAEQRAQEKAQEKPNVLDRPEFNKTDEELQKEADAIDFDNLFNEPKRPIQDETRAKIARIYADWVEEAVPAWVNDLSENEAKGYLHLLEKASTSVGDPVAMRRLDAFEQKRQKAVEKEAEKANETKAVEQKQEAEQERQRIADQIGRLSNPKFRDDAKMSMLAINIAGDIRRGMMPKKPVDMGVRTVNGQPVRQWKDNSLAGIIDSPARRQLDNWVAMAKRTPNYELPHEGNVDKWVGPVRATAGDKVADDIKTMFMRAVNDVRSSRGETEHPDFFWGVGGQGELWRLYGAEPAVNRRGKPVAGDTEQMTLFEEKVAPQSKMDKVMAFGLDLASSFFKKGADTSFRSFVAFADARTGGNPNARKLYGSWYTNAAIALPPELAVKIDANVEAQARALAGLAPRGVDRPGARVATVVQEHLMPSVPTVVDAVSYNGGLDADQQLGVNLALAALSKPNGHFMIADGTGFGKTRQELAIADQYLKAHPNAQVLILTKSDTILKDSFARDSQAMGVDTSRLTLGTYNGLTAGKFDNTVWDVAILDEAHLLSNPESQRTRAYWRLKIRHKVFATATPMDRPTDATYFMAELNNLPQEALANALDYRIEVRDSEDGKPYQVAVPMAGNDFGTIQRNVIIERDKAIAGGRMMRRAYPFLGDIELDHNIPMSEEHHANEGEIVRYYDGEVEAVKYKRRIWIAGPNGRGGKYYNRKDYEDRPEAWNGIIERAKRALRNQKYQELDKLNESMKANETAVLADRILKENPNARVIIVGSQVGPQTINGGFPGEKQMQLTGYKATVERNGIHYQIEPSLKVASRRLAALGYGNDIAHIHTGYDKTAEQADFIGGRKRILVMTAKSGGTGVNLDDTTGAHPTVMLVLNKDYSAKEIDQLLGRVSRKNTRSAAKAYFLTNSSLADAHKAQVANKKLGILKAIQGGADMDIATGMSNERRGDDADDGTLREEKHIYTGSAADYEKPSLDYVGTGEGLQAYGWGLYGSNRRGVSRSYAVSDVSRKGNGKLPFMRIINGSGTKKNGVELVVGEKDSYSSKESYWSDKIASYTSSDNEFLNEAKRYGDDIYSYARQHVGDYEFLNDITSEHIYEQTFFTNREPGDESHLLNWYDPISEENLKRIVSQAEREGWSVEKNERGTILTPPSAIRFSNASVYIPVGSAITGEAVYKRLSTSINSPKNASEFLARADIDGIKYPVDSYGKTVKDGDKVGWNYVSFRDDNITVDHKWRDGEQLFEEKHPIAQQAELEGVSPEMTFFHNAAVDNWRADHDMAEIAKFANVSVEELNKRVDKLRSNPKDAEDRIRAIELLPVGQPVGAVDQALFGAALVKAQDEYHALFFAREAEKANGNDALADTIAQQMAAMRPELERLQNANARIGNAWGLSGRARQLAVLSDYSLAAVENRVRRSQGGRPLTPEQQAMFEELVKRATRAGIALDDERFQRIAFMLDAALRDDLAAKDKAVQQQKLTAKGRDAIVRDYQAALTALKYHGQTHGGILVGLPRGKHWLDALQRYHLMNGEGYGADGKVDEIGMIRLIEDDCAAQGVDATDWMVRQMLSNMGQSVTPPKEQLELDRRELNTLHLVEQQIAYIEKFNELPPTTGFNRDAPTLAVRELRKRRAQLIKEKGLDAGQEDAKLKSALDTMKTRLQNRIEELENAVRTGVKIEKGVKNKLTDPELVALQMRLKQAKELYDAAFPKTDDEILEGKVMRAVKALGRTRKQWQDMLDAAKKTGTFDKAQKEKLDDPRILSVQGEIDAIKAEWQALKDALYPNGTEQERAKKEAQRMNALQTALDDAYSKLAAYDMANTFADKLAALQKNPRPETFVTEAIAAKRAELDAARKAIDDRIRDLSNAVQSPGVKAYNVVDTIINVLPRALRTMGDFSQVLSQGAIATARLGITNPKTVGKALADTFKAFASQDKANYINQALAEDPYFQDFQKMGGRVYGDIGSGGVADEFRGSERKVLGVSVDMIPGVKASERSFGAYLNALNVGLYKALVTGGAWDVGGPTETQRRELAELVSTVTGSAAKDGRPSKAWASALFFAPRFALATAKIATLQPIVKPFFTRVKDPAEAVGYGFRQRAAISRAAATTLVPTLLGIAAFQALLNALFNPDDDKWQDFLDPRSSDFLAARFGKVRINVLKPISIWWTLLARFITGQTAHYGVVKNADRASLVGRTIQGKLGPFASIVYDIVSGKTFTGDAIDWGKFSFQKEGERSVSGVGHVIENALMPMIVNDLVDLFKNDPALTASALAPAVFFGARMTSYDDDYARTVEASKGKLDAFNRLAKGNENQGVLPDLTAAKAYFDRNRKAISVADQLRVGKVYEDMATLERKENQYRNLGWNKEADDLLKQRMEQQKMLVALYKKLMSPGK